MGKTREFIEELIATSLSSINSFISVKKKLTYSDDFVFDNARDIPSKGYVDSLVSGVVGTTALSFTQLNLVAMGNGSFKLPLVLAAGQAVLAIKVAITSGSTYQMPASEWSNNEIINFDSNVPQTITVITS